MQTIVLVTGGFDPVHGGHISYLNHAEHLGDQLIVGLNSDAWLERKKGQAFMSWHERMTILDNLHMVHNVIDFDDTDGTAIDAIRKVKEMYPKDKIIFANGGDRTKDNITEMVFSDVEFVFGVGGEDKKNSSSWLLQDWNSSNKKRPQGKTMRKLFYMGLEPYKARYTLQLQEWNERVFKRRKIKYVIVPGETLTTDQAIVTGQVLDAHGRTYFGMSQLMNLVRMMKAGECTNEDVVYFEDMFQPGIESLPYILNQIGSEHRPRIFVRCLAQSIDPDDFVHVWGMSEWMGHYEKMVDSFVDGVLATNEEMVMHMKIAGWKAPIYNISGLAFGLDEVQSRVEKIKNFKDRRMRVVFSSRWDQEKQPDFYMDLIEAYYISHPNHNTEFVICSGSSLKSNNQSYMNRTRKFEEKGWLTVYENLEKNAYYNILNDSRVVFNCALQDWVSNTVSEADGLGCNVLFPAYRSFPETFSNDHTRLYIPWSIEDALTKLEKLLAKPHVNIGKISKYNDGTIDRICDILQGKGDSMLRMSTDYRKYLRESKY